MKCHKVSRRGLYSFVIYFAAACFSLILTSFFLVPKNISNYYSSLEERNSVGPPPNGSCVLVGCHVIPDSCCETGRCSGCLKLYRNLTYLDHQHVRRYTQPLVANWTYLDERDKERASKDVDLYVRTKEVPGTSFSCWVGYGEPTWVIYEDPARKNEEDKARMWLTSGLLITYVIFLLITGPLVYRIERSGSEISMRVRCRRKQEEEVQVILSEPEVPSREPRSVGPEVTSETFDLRILGHPEPNAPPEEA